jgi:hypothetical protein
LCLHHRDNEISRLLESAARHDLIPIQSYKDLTDAVAIAADFITSVTESTVTADFSADN